MKTTWILIANASEARLFKTEKHPKDMELIDEFHHPESRQKVVNLVTGGIGSYRKASSTPKSSFEEPTNPKQVEVENFAHELAAKLNEGRNKNLYKNLVLIAPSQFRGLLNKYCNEHVKSLILVALNKDYTKLKKDELSQCLNGLKLHRVA
jgi:protein required for attachment to host cells